MESTLSSATGAAQFAEIGGLTVGIVIVTPDLAYEWLKRNRRNRRLRQRRIDSYARQMSIGRWKLNGETIVFDLNGNLIQGQHRLHACIKAGQPFTTLIVRGVEPDVFSTLDQHGKRTTADNFDLVGEINSSILAAAATKLVLHERGALYTGAAADRDVSVEDALEALDRHPNLRESVQVARSVGRLAPPSMIATLHYLFAGRDHELSEWFFGAIATGEKLRKADAVYLLRERLILNSAAKARLREKDLAALVIKAWNAHRSGKAIKTLRWRNYGNSPEAFPEIQ
jgi:hypothetical protein